MGKRFSGLLVEMREKPSRSGPRCIIAGGETTVKVRGRGVVEGIRSSHYLWP